MLSVAIHLVDYFRCHLGPLYHQTKELSTQAQKAFIIIKKKNPLNYNGLITYSINPIFLVKDPFILLVLCHLLPHEIDTGLLLNKKCFLFCQTLFVECKSFINYAQIMS